LTLTPSRAAGPAGFTVSVAVLTTPLYVAVMVTVVGTVTAALVVTGNVAIVAPAATVTEPEAGTLAFGLLLVSVTTAPPVGAALPSVTVPVLPLPPVTAAGKTLTPTSRGFSVSVEFVDAPRHVAVMVACVGTVTTLVVTWNVAIVAPAATVTEPEAGTVAAALLLLLSVTTAPPAGAALVSVTVPVLFVAPPISTEGFIVKEPSSVFTTSPVDLEMPS